VTTTIIQPVLLPVTVSVSEQSLFGTAIATMPTDAQMHRCIFD
jgi:hypothetical protein